MVHMIRPFNCVCNRRVTEALKWILNFVKYLSPIFPTYLMVEKSFFFFVSATLSGVETLKYPPFFLLKDAFKTKTLRLVAWKNNSCFAVRRYDKIAVRIVLLTFSLHQYVATAIWNGRSGKGVSFNIAALRPWLISLKISIKKNSWTEHFDRLMILNHKTINILHKIA